MTTAEPTEDYGWLPIAAVLDHLKVNGDTSPNVEAIERARRAAAQYCEDARRDLVLPLYDDPFVRGFRPGPRIVEAGVLLAARLYSRTGSPAGTAAFGDGVIGVLRGADPDVDRMLGVGRYAAPGIA